MTRPLMIATALALLAGCGSTKYHLVNPGVSLTPVEFESDAGMRAFRSTLKKGYADGDARVGSSNRMWSKGAYHNQQINVADTNGDGVISDAEAVRYARR